MKAALRPQGNFIQVSQNSGVVLGLLWQRRLNTVCPPRMSDKVDKALYCICVCRALALFTAGIFALIISGKVSGLTYYALVEDKEGFNPYCRAIVFPEAVDGTKIDFGTFEPFGGGTAVDTGIKVNTGLLLSSVQSYKYKANAELRGKVLGDSECNFMAVEVGKTEHNDRNKVLLMNTKTNKQMKMPAACGGDEPGEWVEILDMWATPLVVSTLIWMTLKLTQVGVEAWIISQHLDGVRFKIGLLFASAFASVVMTFFIAPIQNMKMDVCPQLVTSWYSGMFQTGFAIAAGVLLSCVCCLGVFACYTGSATGMAENVLGGGGIVVGGCGGAALIVALVGGVLYSYQYFLFYFFIGFNFDLKFYWPRFSFAANINFLHVFTCVLWLLDVVKVLTGSVKLFIDTRDKAASAAEPAAV